MTSSNRGVAPKRGFRRIFIAIAVSIAMLLGFMQPAHAAGGVLYLNMTAVPGESGGSPSKNLQLGSGAPLQFVINYGCQTEVPCASPRITVPFAPGIILGGSSAVGWTESRQGNVVTFTRSTIPSSSAGQITILAQVPPTGVSNGQVFSQTASMSGFQSETAVDTPVSITAAVGSNTAVNVSLEAGGGLNSNTTYAATACLSARENSGLQGVQANSQMTVQLPPNTTLVDDGGAQVVGDTLRFTLAAFDNYGCVSKTFKVAYRTPENQPGDTKVVSATWVGAMVGESTRQLGDGSSTNIIPDPGDAGAATLGVTLVTPRSDGSLTPPKLAWIGDDVNLVFDMPNDSPGMWKSAVVDTNIPSITKAMSARGANHSSGPGAIFIKRDGPNGGDWEKIYDLEAGEAFNFDFYQAQNFPTGVTKLDPEENVVDVKLELNGEIQPGSGGKGALNIATVVRSNDRITDNPVAQGDLGQFTPHGDVEVPAGDLPVDAMFEAQLFQIKSKGMGMSTRFGCSPPGCGPLPINVHDFTAVGSFAAPYVPVPDPVMVFTVPNIYNGTKLFDVKNPDDVESNFEWLGPVDKQPTLSSVRTIDMGNGLFSSAYRFTWPEGTIMAQNSDWAMNIDLKTDPALPSGNYNGLLSPLVVVSSATSPLTGDIGCGGGNWWYGGPDSWDLNGNGNLTEGVCSWGINPTPPANPAYSISQGMLGAWDTDYSPSPGTSYSDPWATNKLRATLSNTGNVALNTAKLLTTLPRPGDHRILAPGAGRSPATHTFPINLAGKPEVPEGAKVEWTLSSYPCVENLVDNGQCDSSPNWTDWNSSAPSDLSAVGAVLVTFPGMTLAAGNSWSATMDVVTPPTVSPDVSPCTTPEQLELPPCEPTFAIQNTILPYDAANNEKAIGSSAGVANRVDLGLTMAALESPLATLEMPSPDGPNPAAPVAERYESTASYNTPQSVNIWYPPNGGITLLDGDDNPVTELDVFISGEKVGTYSMDSANCGNPGPQAGSCPVTFTPESTFAGGFPPAVKYEINNFSGQKADNVYQAFVDPPAAPSPIALTSTGEGTETQYSQEIDVAPGNTICLLDASFMCSLTNEVVVPDIGTFKLNTETNVISFEPVLGYHGSNRQVFYQETDELGQTGLNTYTPTVTKPAGPSAENKVGEGPQNTAVEVDVILPSDATLELLHTNGIPAGDGPVTIDGQGVYTISSGKLVFMPAADWSGQAQPVTYQVTDPYGQSAEATFTPTIWSAVPAPVDQFSSGPMKAKQSVTVSPPVGGQVKLLDCSDDPCTAVDQLEVSGEGVYTVNPDTGLIEFVPEDDFTGEATGVNYRVIDDKDQYGDAKYTPTVWPPAPNPDALVMEGPMGTESEVSISVPTNGSVKLLDCNSDEPPVCVEVDEISLPNVGVYKVTGAGKFTFNPEPDFTGVAPAVPYRVTDEHDQKGESTAQATVWDAAPVAEPLDSEGPMGVDQSVTVTPPNGGQVKLIDDNGQAVNEVVVDEEGTYTVNPNTGLITFSPDEDFSGVATPVNYRIIDAKGQNSASTYTPTVWDAAPLPEDKNSAGPMRAEQSVTIAPPAGGRVMLLDCSADPCAPVDSLVVSGEGSYEVTPTTGEITFTPEDEFWGTATPVKFRVLDAKDQYGDAEYKVQVWDPAPSPTDRRSNGQIGKPQSVSISKPTGGTVKLVDGGVLVDELTVVGEGTYTVNPATGKITFTPESDFVGEATPATFRVIDEFEQWGEATYTATVVPAPTVVNIEPGEGPLTGGNKITITGTNLTGASVKVGGRICTNVVIRDVGTSLTCVVPAGAKAGLVKIEVTTLGGTVSRNNAYRYLVVGPEKKPLAPKKVEISGKPTAKKRVVSWSPPANPAGKRPVQWYRIKLNRHGCKSLIINKKLSKNTTRYTFKRAFLLKNLRCKGKARGELRGEFGSAVRFRVVIEAFNSVGGGPVSRSNFLVKL